MIDDNGSCGSGRGSRSRSRSLDDNNMWGRCGRGIAGWTATKKERRRTIKILVSCDHASDFQITHPLRALGTKHTVGQDDEMGAGEEASGGAEFCLNKKKNAFQAGVEAQQRVVAGRAREEVVGGRELALGGPAQNISCDSASQRTTKYSDITKRHKKVFFLLRKETECVAGLAGGTGSLMSGDLALFKARFPAPKCRKVKYHSGLLAWVCVDGASKAEAEQGPRMWSEPMRSAACVPAATRRWTSTSSATRTDHTVAVMDSMTKKLHMFLSSSWTQRKMSERTSWEKSHRMRLKRWCGKEREDLMGLLLVTSWVKQARYKLFKLWFKDYLKVMENYTILLLGNTDLIHSQSYNQHVFWVMRKKKKCYETRTPTVFSRCAFHPQQQLTFHRYFPNPCDLLYTTIKPASNHTLEVVGSLIQAQDNPELFIPHQTILMQICKFSVCINFTFFYYPQKFVILF
ncbi:hypothetical protein VP01_1716g2 [Puccinia sorghi]|uniref:Uncharacterized protein n=1 Tax=Puccinia sorghi TaxID=27349 RepID=A0A0L6VFE5_9BASI|nr:hypothetical protein VP01_1716g2 [Puccinia sorghi]